jgi:hypothetical protein
MADAEMAAGLFYRIQEKLRHQFKLAEVPHRLLLQAQDYPKKTFSTQFYQTACHLGLSLDAPSNDVT